MTLVQACCKLYTDVNQSLHSSVFRNQSEDCIRPHNLSEQQRNSHQNDNSWPMDAQGNALEEQQHGGGKRHWMDVKGIVLDARLPSKKRMCAVWLDELVQVPFLCFSRAS